MIIISILIAILFICLICLVYKIHILKQRLNRLIISCTQLARVADKQANNIDTMNKTIANIIDTITHKLAHKTENKLDGAKVVVDLNSKRN